MHRVDKVTLKLYFSFAKSGKFERALDVTHQLRLEKSFDIALKAADQLNHRTLSSRIHELQYVELNLISINDFLNDKSSSAHTTIVCITGSSKEIFMMYNKLEVSMVESWDLQIQ